MNEKEFKEFKEIMIAQQKSVSTSKKAAMDLLIQLGIITPKGNLKKGFKSLVKIEKV